MKGADVLLTSMFHLCLQAPGGIAYFLCSGSSLCIWKAPWFIMWMKRCHNLMEVSHCSAKVLTVQVVLYKSTAVKALSALFWLWWLGISTSLSVQVDELPFYQSQALHLEWVLSVILFCVSVVVLSSTWRDNVIQFSIFYFVSIHIHFDNEISAWLVLMLRCI